MLRSALTLSVIDDASPEAHIMQLSRIISCYTRCWPMKYILTYIIHTYRQAHSSVDILIISAIYTKKKKKAFLSQPPQ